MHSQSTCGKLNFGNTRLLSGRNNRQVPAKASKEHSKLQERTEQPAKQQKQERKGGLGDVLGPIGLTLGGELNKVRSRLTEFVRQIVSCRISLSGNSSMITAASVLTSALWHLCSAQSTLSK